MNTCMSHDEMIFDDRKLGSKVDEDAIPSAVVLNLNSIPKREEIGSIIESWLSKGAVHFALTGREFGEIEDEVDWVIVDECDECHEIVGEISHSQFGVAEQFTQLILINGRDQTRSEDSDHTTRRSHCGAQGSA